MLGRLLGAISASLRGKRTPPNPLAGYFFNNPGRLIDKWHHYFEVYHRHFERFRGRSPVVLEIGVSHGGSLQMWREYFGPGAHIVGVDVDARCLAFAEPSIDIHIGDQADRAFLGGLRRRYPRIDLVIDDGGHTVQQQVTSFEELYPHLHAEGVYLCEDLHTNYSPQFGGGLRRPGTFIEHAKSLVDSLHGWYGISGLEVDGITRSTGSLHFYDSIFVAEKRPMQPPQSSKTGAPSF